MATRAPAESDVAHMGPFPLPNGGTLTAQDREAIYNATYVSASVRWRQQWNQRCLSLSGPAGQLETAKAMAYAKIEEHGTEGGRRSEPAGANAAASSSRGPPQSP